MECTIKDVQSRRAVECMKIIKLQKQVQELTAKLAAVQAENERLMKMVAKL